MLSVPTLWTAFIVNFLALGLIWAYVLHSYPKFEAARFWTGSAFVAALGAALAMLRFAVDSLLPLVAGGTMMIFAACLGAMGIRRFYDHPVQWRVAALTTGLSLAGLTFFVIGYDSMPMRVLVYSLGQSAPMALTLKLLLSRQDGRINPGARLAGIVSILIIAMYVVRAGGSMLHLDFSFTHFTPLQSVVVLVLMFLSMAWNFGFLLMAIDALRNEVADLALLDDLTGVGNRRHLLQRLTEECAKSERSGEPFALLVIDLDGFKAVNDTHGHAAGDACLDAARGRHDRAPHRGCVPRRRRGLRGRRYSDRSLDRRRAMDQRDRRAGPADRRRRSCALRRQERRQEPPCGL
jgi:hypothetical protein